MSQMKQKQHSYSSPTQNSKIVEEAKRLLVGDLHKCINDSIESVLMQWVGKDFNELRSYNPQIAVDRCMEKFIINRSITQFNVNVNIDSREIQIEYKLPTRKYYTIHITIS